MFELILPLLNSILPGVLKSVLPAEKMTDEEAAKIQIELSAQLAAQDWQQIKAEYDDRNNARALAATEIAKGNAFTSFLSATVRPAWGYAALIFVGYSIVNNIAISPQLQSIIETVLFFFFGGRTIEKITPIVSGIFNKGK